jgi:hypothetical protein
MVKTNADYYDHHPKYENLISKAARYLQMDKIVPQVMMKEEHETEAPIAFTYSLYYVYYDQYTYIRGVMF